MQFGNQGNNNREATNVNTRGQQFSNKDGFFPSTLVTGFWNGMISLKMHPALEKSKQTDSRVFDYDTVVNTSVTLEKAAILIEKIEQDIIPALKANEELFKGIPVGVDSLMGVGTRNLDGKMVAYFAIFKALDPDTRKPEAAMMYEFKQTYTIDNYDPKSGDFNKSSDGVNGELLLFLHVLKASCLGLSNAMVHANRVVDKYYRDRLLNTVNEIAAKHGISTGASSAGKGGYGKRSDIFSGGGSFNGGTNDNGLPSEFDSAPTGSLEHIDDIESFMN